MVAGRFSSPYSLTATIATLPQELDVVHYYSPLFTNNSLIAFAKTLTAVTPVLYALEKVPYNGTH